MNRTERQAECLKNWLRAKGKGTIVAATGFGKTRVALNTIMKFLEINDRMSVLIVVPTEVLKDQWLDELIERDIVQNCRVEIINTVIKNDWTCDLLIQDECHLYAADTFKQVFEKVTYKFIMCLTGTLERLDGKEEIIKHYAPVCDQITIKEAEENGWVSPIKEYLVMLDVDLTEYERLNQAFNGYFSYFGWDFNVAMRCATNAVYRNKFAKYFKKSIKEVSAMAFGWISTMKKRKEFVMQHPKKLEVCRKILKARKDKKCITFSATIKYSEQIGTGYVLHSKQSKKKNAEILKAFNDAESGVLNTNKAADQGVDIKGLSVGIILSTDSSKIRKGQRTGRVIRFEPGKTAELFTLVIRGTQEVGWANNSATRNFITINEEQLDRVLKGEEVKTRQREIVTTYKYRY